MTGAARFERVREIIVASVEASGAPPRLRDALILQLSDAGKVLSYADGARPPRWPQVVLACAASATDAPQPTPAAYVVAAAVEVFMAGTDVIDDIEDDDSSRLIEALGTARALNAGAALLMLGQRMLGDLESAGVQRARVAHFMTTLASAAFDAAGGQQRDLDGEGRDDLSADEALALARDKAGRLVGAACRLGAMTSTTEEELLALYERWGRHYGTAAQLANDLHDAQDMSRKSDWRRRKATLPRLFASRGASATGESASASTVAASGALHFTWVVLDIELQLARQVADDLAARGRPIDELAVLVS